MSVATVRRPQNLAEHEYVVLACARDTGELSLILPDQQSYALGNVWRAEEDAIPYLAWALGKERVFRTLAQEAITTAFNFGASIIHIVERRTQSTLVDDARKDEATALTTMFKQEQHLLDKDDRHEDGVMIVDPMD